MTSYLIPILCLCVGVIILDIWYRLGRSESENKLRSGNIYDPEKKDYGLFFLAISLLVWFLTGTISKLIVDIEASKLFKTIFSTLNSVFLLVSIGYFEYAPQIIRKHRTLVNKILLAVVLIVISSTFILYKFNFTSTIDLPDFIFSIPTAGITAYVYFLTFWHRNFTALAYYTVITLLLLLASQTYPAHFYQHIFHNDFSQFTSAFSRLSFIFIICFLGYSWEHERYSKVLHKYNSNIDNYFKIIEERDRLIETSSSNARESVWKEVSLKAAHKLGNPLDAIEVYIDSLEKNLLKYNLADNHTKKITKIKEKIYKAKRLIQEFKHFGGHMELRKHQCDLIQIINSSSETIIENSVEFEFSNLSTHTKYDMIRDQNLLHKLPGVLLKMDAEKIRDCFDELFSNSLKWFRKNTIKKIKIIISDCEETDLVASGEDVSSYKKYIKISYYDNGIGIKDENKRLIFAPFYTTDNQGTGMGLSIVEKIIRLHNGFIYEKGEHGKGAIFIILLTV